MKNLQSIIPEQFKQISSKNKKPKKDQISTNAKHRIRARKTPAISVIVPVFNAQPYLTQCLESILRQTLQDIEIICVDDGSTDDSLAVLKEYAAKDPRFIVATQSNLGSGQARNHGIKIASGEYIAFMDADDFYPTNHTLENLFHAAKKNNVNLCGGSLNQYKDGKIIDKPSAFEQEYSFDKDGIIEFADYQFDYGYWRFIYNRQFLFKNKIFFPDYLRQQDPPFFIKAMVKAKEFYALKEPTYVYRLSHKSIMWTERKTCDLLKGLIDCLNLSKKHNCPLLHAKIVQRLNAWTFRTAVAATVKYASVRQLTVKLLHTVDHKILSAQNIKFNPDDLYLAIENSKKTNVLVSVIIPVYNGEQYVQKCLESIVNQSLDCVEIICVDDGSTDNTLNILEQYAKDDKRVKILSINHCGLAGARNAGIEHAKGSYLYFCDSDDWAELDTLEKALAKMTGLTDYVSWGASIINHGLEEGNRGIVIGRQYHKIKLTGQKAVNDDIILSSTLTVWNKLFKTKIISDYHIRFSTGRLFEDNDFCIIYFLHSREGHYLNDYLYNYVQRPGTIMEKVRARQCNRTEDNLYIFDNIYQHCKKEKLLELHCKLLTSRFLTHLRAAYKFAREDRKEKIKELACHFAKNYHPEIINCPTLKYLQSGQFNKVDEFKELIVSLTSHPKRIDTVHLAIESIFNQTLKADRIILWLAYEQFPHKEKDLPSQLLALKELGLSIEWYHDIKSYKKLIPTLHKYPDEIIVTVDDDNIYPPCLLEKLYNNYKRFPNDIHCHRVTKFYYDNGFKVIAGGKEYYKNGSYLNKIVGMGGALYPPHCFYKDILDEDLFMKLAPTNDDQWFWLQAVLNGVKIRVVPHPEIEAHYIPGTQECGLTTINDHGERLFWKDFSNLITYYKDLTSILLYGNKKSLSKKLKAYLLFPYYWCHVIYLQNKKNLNQFKPPLQKDYTYYKSLMPSRYKPELCAWFKRVTKTVLNLNAPQTYNQKIQWLKLYDSTPLKTKLADKYLVRQWVKDKIGEKYLIPLLGVYNKFSEIDFSALPNRFVIKANHGSGWNYVVKNKDKLDYAELKQKTKNWLSKNFAYRAGFELHYKNIKPRIIIEEYIENQAGDLYDYKFWCFNGKVKYIQFLSDRNISGLKMAFFDKDWNKQPFAYNYPLNTNPVPKPDNLDEMIELAEKLAQGFAHVRVDFYRLNDGKIYFGEMTFTTASGTCKWNLPEWDAKLGALFSLPKKSPIPFNTIDLLNIVLYNVTAPWRWWQNFPCSSNINRYAAENVLSQIACMRIDIKNMGNANNTVEFLSPCEKISAPSWLADGQGIGKVVESNARKLTFKIMIRHKGKLTLTFRGPDKQDSKTRLPIWIDFNSIKINNQEILSHRTSVWHNQPFKFETAVDDGQVMVIEAEQSYHHYSRSELKDLIFKLYYHNTYMRQHLSPIAKAVLKKIKQNKTSTVPYKRAQKANQEVISFDKEIKVLKKQIDSLNRKIADLEKKNAELVAHIQNLR